MVSKFLTDKNKDKKIFLIIQTSIYAIMIILILIQLIFIGGNGEDKVKKEIICGDNFLDRGENSKTCCQDAGCETGFNCLKNGEEYSCQKLSKTETENYKEFINLGKTLLNQEYNFQDEGNTQEITKTLFNKSLTELKDKGFNVTTEEITENIIINHLNLLKRLNELNQETAKFSSKPAFLEVYYQDKGNPVNVKNELELNKNISSEAIQLINEFNKKLNNLNEEEKTFLNDKMNFQINEKIDSYNNLLEQYNETNLKTTNILSKI